MTPRTLAAVQTRHPRLLAGLLILALLASMLTLPDRALAEADEPEVTRIAGQDRFETAARIAAETNPDGTDDVIIAAGFAFPDALAASGFGGAVDATILLVNDVHDTATEFTLQALAELSPARVHIAGGTAAVSASIESQLAAAGDWQISRFAGADRFETAALMAQAIGAGNVFEGTAIVATGRVAADSLAAGPLAHSSPYPILLTESDALPAATAGALEGLGIASVLVLGGISAVSDRVIGEIEQITGPGSVTRLNGANRFETAVEVAQIAPFSGGSRVLLATGFGPGSVPADALSGGPYGGGHEAELLPINDVTAALPNDVATYLHEHAEHIDEIVVLGGEQAVPSSVVDAARAAASGVPPSNQTFEVTPLTTRLIEVDGDPGSPSAWGEDGPTAEYLIEGLESEQTYQIALLPCGDEREDATVKRAGAPYPSRTGASADGIFTFADTDLDDIADRVGETMRGDLDIVSVGSSSRPAGTQQTMGASSADGTLIFEIGVSESIHADCAVPVVWEDDPAGNGAELDLDPSSTDTWNEPAEAFGVGGAVAFHFGQAPDDTAHHAVVVYLDVAERLLVLDDGYRYHYARSGDLFEYDGYGVVEELSAAAFASVTSIGDRVGHDGEVGSGPYTADGDTVFVNDRDRSGRVVEDVLAQAGDHNGDASTEDVRVIWALADGPGSNFRQFEVVMLDADDHSLVDTATSALVETGDPSDASTEVVFEDVADGEYVFRVFGVNTTQMQHSSRLSSRVTVNGDSGDPGDPGDPGEPASGPVIVSQEVTTDTVAMGTLDNGDVIEVTFDGEMIPDEDPSLYFRWESGDDVYQVGCFTESACSWGGADGLDNNVLTMDLVADPVHQSGPDNGLDITGDGALMVLVSSGVQSLDGDPVDLDSSPDRYLTN